MPSIVSIGWTDVLMNQCAADKLLDNFPSLLKQQ